MSETSTLSILLATNNSSLISNMKGAWEDICCVTDGFQAIEIAARSKPDVILLSESLDNLPGSTTAVWLKVNPATCSIPIIGINAGTDCIRDESGIDARLDIHEIESRLPEVIRAIKSKTANFDCSLEVPNERYNNSFNITLGIIETYRERLALINSLMNIASQQHSIGDLDHTIKLLLETGSKALQASLFSITLLKKKAEYILVNNQYMSNRDLENLEKKTALMLEGLLHSPLELKDKVVIGRRLLCDCENLCAPRLKFFGYPISLSGNLAGYISGYSTIEEKSEQWSSILLRDFSAFASVILSNAESFSETDQHVAELAAILRAALETSSISPVSTCQDTNPLLQFLIIVLELCKSTRGCVILFDEQESRIAKTAVLGCQLEEIYYGASNDGLSLMELLQKLKADEMIIDTDPASHCHAGRIILPLAVGDRIMGGLVVLDISATMSFQLLQAVRTLAGMCGYFVFNSALYEQTMKASIIEEQLNIAREIQRDMLPSYTPNVPGFEIYGRSQPARQVGGDFFEYLTSSDGRFQIAIADVSGKGIPASMLMTMTRALVIAANEKTEGPDKVLTEVNSHLVNRILSGQFVTASLLSIGSDEITYASAGHSPILIYRPEKDEFEEFNPEGVAMGIVDGFAFEKISLELNPGDIALMYTDGLNEAMNVDKEQFGYERIKDIIKNHAKESAEEIVEALFKATEEHSKGRDQFDDTTIIAIKRIIEKEHSNASRKNQD